MNEVILEIRNVSKTYKISKKQQKKMNMEKLEIKAVEDFSLELYKGEIFCLLGNNGAGKTTALRMIATLIEPQGGTIKIDGISICNNTTIVKKEIGFLTTELKLDDFFTPNYMIDFFGKMYQMNQKEISSRKEKLFKVLGIDRFAEVKIRKLSTGMKQKVSIAISLIHNPDIIIFDEPTNGLDIVTTREVTNFLELLKMEGRTILVSTHIFDIVDKLADRVGIMVDGHLVYCNSYKEMIQEKHSVEEAFFEVYERKRENKRQS